MMNLSRQDEPLYQTLASTIRAELSMYKPGDLLPGELRLAERFDVNRHTVRRALDLLVQEGNVIRIKGKGTKVLTRPLLYPVQAKTAYTDQFSAMGHTARAQLLKVYRRPANHDELTQLALAPGSAVLEYRTLRFIDNEPISVMTHFFSSGYEALLQNYKRDSMRQYLKERGCELQRASSVIGARLPTIDEASRLLIPQSAPVLTVTTLSKNQHGHPVELTFSVSRADRFQYQVVLNGEHI